MTDPSSRITNSRNTDEHIKAVISKKGWHPGSSLENRFMLHLTRMSVRPPQLVQQHPVGRYRLDFADPDVLMAIEADGFFHRMPGAADRDAARDARLLTQGWHVFRVPDDRDDDELTEMLLAAVLLIQEERTHQNLPRTREGLPRPRGFQPKPSRLAIARGYRKAPAQ